jgi:hypothetical protein
MCCSVGTQELCGMERPLAKVVPRDSLLSVHGVPGLTHRNSEDLSLSPRSPTSVGR